MSRAIFTPQTKEERAETLRHRVHLAALKALLHKYDPEIYSRNIETHQGRRAKALHDLNAARLIKYTGVRKPKDSWDRDENTYWVTESFDSWVAQYAAASTGQGENVIREDLNGALSNIHHRFQHKPITEVGWSDITNASLALLAHVWTHRDEYLYRGENKRKNATNDLDDKPRAWDKCTQPLAFIHRTAYENLPKMLLRNAVEIYAGTMSDYLTLKEAGCMGWSNDATFDVTVPNVGAVNPTHMNINTIQCHIRKGIEVLKKYSETCEKIETAIERNGGESAWNKVILTRAIQEMLSTSPLIAAAGDEAHPSGKRLSNMQDLSRYVLEHGGLMSYEKLFDDRPGMWALPEKPYASNDVDPVDAFGKDLLSSGFKTLLFGEEDDM
jgi:hypothetical protein